MPLEDIQDPFLRSVVAKVLAQQQGSPAPAAPAAPVPTGSPDAGADPYAGAINHLLQQRTQRDWSVMPIPPPRSANENDVGGRYFLSGLTQGWNNQFRDRGARRDSELSRLLQLQEQKRYHDLQADNMAADNARADQALKDIAAQREWARQNGDARTEGYLKGVEEGLRHHLATEQGQAESRGETARYHRVLSGQAATREKRIAAGGGKGGGKGQDISPQVAAYYKAIGDRILANAPADKNYPALRDKVNAWVDKQIETAKLNEAARRQGLGKQEATPTVDETSPEAILQKMRAAGGTP